MVNRTNAAFVEELPRLLEQRGMSLLALSRAAGVDYGHLWRVAHGKKRLTGHVARDLGRALGLPEGFFPEARRDFVFDAVERDPELRDRLYDQLVRSQRRSRR